jgi:hypothetical protein
MVARRSGGERGKGGIVMAEPFIFIGTHSVKEGKLEDFKQNSRSSAPSSRRTNLV